MLYFLHLFARIFGAIFKKPPIATDCCPLPIAVYIIQQRSNNNSLERCLDSSMRILFEITIFFIVNLDEVFRLVQWSERLFKFVKLNDQSPSRHFFKIDFKICVLQLLGNFKVKRIDRIIYCELFDTFKKLDIWTIWCYKENNRTL